MIKKYIILINFILITFGANGQQSYDLSKISEEKMIIDSKLVIGHENKLKKIILLAVDLTLNNIVNYNTTRTSVSIMQKEKFRLIYDPVHPDSFLNGDLKGYVRYPDIDIWQECSDIAAMIEILRLIDNIIGITDE